MRIMDCVYESSWRYLPHKAAEILCILGQQSSLRAVWCGRPKTTARETEQA